jgi:hypothetical protein
MDCGNLPQLADSVRLATPLARFGKVDRAATNQKVGSSNPPGRTIYLNKTKAISIPPENGRVGLRLRATSMQPFLDNGLAEITAVALSWERVCKKIMQRLAGR